MSGAWVATLYERCIFAYGSVWTLPTNGLFTGKNWSLFRCWWGLRTSQCATEICASRQLCPLLSLSPCNSLHAFLLGIMARSEFTFSFPCYLGIYEGRNCYENGIHVLSIHLQAKIMSGIRWCHKPMERYNPFSWTYLGKLLTFIFAGTHKKAVNIHIKMSEEFNSGDFFFKWKFSKCQKIAFTLFVMFHNFIMIIKYCLDIKKIWLN